MQAFIIVLKHTGALGCAGDVVLVGIDNVAGEDVLPEGEASGGTYDRVSGELNS